MRLFTKISALLISFFFLTGFIPFAVLLGPASTMISTGNAYKAGLQILVDHGIKQKTGKTSLVLVKEELDKKNSNKEFNDKLRKLVEERIKIARKKIELQNINQ